MRSTSRSWRRRPCLLRRPSHTSLRRLPCQRTSWPGPGAASAAWTSPSARSPARARWPAHAPARARSLSGMPLVPPGPPPAPPIRPCSPLLVPAFTPPLLRRHHFVAPRHKHSPDRALRVTRAHARARCTPQGLLSRHAIALLPCPSCRAPLVIPPTPLAPPPPDPADPATSRTAPPPPAHVQGSPPRPRAPADDAARSGGGG